LEDLRPVGEFHADYSKRIIEVQPNAVRRLNESLIKESKHRVNLQHGMNQFTERSEFKNKLFPMLCFLKISEKTYGQNATTKIEDFICTRTSLVQVAGSAYASERVGDDRFDDGFLLVLFKRNNRYYCCEYNTPSKISKTSPGGAGLYTGIKFENYMTLGQNQKEPDLESVASTSTAYNSVFKATLVDKATNTTHNLFYPARVDCVDKNGRYAEIKFRSHPIGQGRSWWRIELTWFLQSFFSDTNRIIIGCSNGSNGVNDIKEIKPDDLDFGRGVYWELDGCLEYLSKFLTEVKLKLNEAPDNTYFYAVRQPNQVEYVITAQRS